MANSSQTRSGQCLCGAVKVSASFPKPEFQACHCHQCQQWTGGGPFYAVRANDISIEGADNITSYNHSEWGERANCKTCGSVLYWTMKGKPPAFLALGLFEEQSDLTLSEEIFVDHRPNWLPAGVSASQSTEAEQMAELNAYLEKNS